LQAVAGVEAVAREEAGTGANGGASGNAGGGECQLRARAAAGRDIRDPIRGALSEAGIVALEIFQERGRLDDVFRAMTAPAASRDAGRGDRA
jgi:hypothetical protein